MEASTSAWIEQTIRDGVAVHDALGELRPRMNGAILRGDVYHAGRWDQFIGQAVLDVRLA